MVAELMHTATRQMLNRTTAMYRWGQKFRALHCSEKKCIKEHYWKAFHWCCALMLSNTRKPWIKWSAFFTHIRVTVFNFEGQLPDITSIYHDNSKKKKEIKFHFSCHNIWLTKIYILKPQLTQKVFLCMFIILKYSWF